MENTNEEGRTGMRNEKEGKQEQGMNRKENTNGE
jgi:hypothetical protein